MYIPKQFMYKSLGIQSFFGVIKKYIFHVLVILQIPRLKVKRLNQSDHNGTWRYSKYIY